MMKYKVLIPNENGKFEFTKEDLEKLLEDVYNEGLEEGKKFTITTPLVENPYHWYTVPHTISKTNPNTEGTFTGIPDVPTKKTQVWMECTGAGNDVLLNSNDVSTKTTTVRMRGPNDVPDVELYANSEKKIDDYIPNTARGSY